VTQLDELDQIAAEAFDGFIVRKDLALKFKGQYPVPTYVGEFLLGRYCASTDPDEIAEGLKIVERQLRDRTVRAGAHELFKSRAREQGSIKLIDLVTARLDVGSDSYLATLPSLQLKDVRIADQMVRDHQRMLTGGFYAEVELEYHAALDEGADSRPFSIANLRPIQLSKRDVLTVVARGREAFTLAQWRAFLLRSVGFEPDRLSARAQDLLLLRMVPFAEHNYNLVELGPRGTGKSHLFQQVSPYSHLVSGGKATVARMFVDMRTGQKGLVAQYDIVCFDEVSGINFDQKDGVNILKGYMESGEYSRGKESIRAFGGVVMVGNFEVDVAQQQRVGHLFSPFPKEMRDDTAFMDRIHAYLPGWDIPKMDPTLFTTHFGLVSDFLAETWTHLRDQTRLPALHDRVTYGPELSGRDTWAVNRTVSGLLKLLYPDAATPIPDEDIAWAVRLAMEVRRRVKEQQKRIGRSEFGKTEFSFVLGVGGAEQVVETAELAGVRHGGGSHPEAVLRPAAVPSVEPRTGAAPQHLEPDLSSDELRYVISSGESTHVEFKSSLRWDVREGADNPGLQKGVTRSIAAFLNTRGGRLLVGVADAGTVVGIEPDIASLEKMGLGAGGRDGFLQALANAVTQHLGAQAAALIRTQIAELDGKKVCVISVGRSPEPVYLHESKEREEFFVRLESTTRPLGLRETTAYIRANWG
jgi:ATP-dependent Lon protease